MRAAGRAGAVYVVIRGDREMDAGTFLVKTMDTGEQEELDLPTMMEKLTMPRLARDMT